MSNRDTHVLRDYHERTKHSVASVRSGGHFLDWENRPLPFKVYPKLEPIPLPRDWQASKLSAVEAIARSGQSGSSWWASTPDLKALARLLQFSAGITRKKEYPDGQVMYFRAAPCTGALYHIDLYLVCGDLPGLEAGVYHFSPHDFSLRCLRGGDYRSLVVAAAGEEESLSTAPVILVSTSTFWRNAWKYQSRAYRHCFWDSGTILAQLFAVAVSDQIAARLVLGFVDATINHLLGLDAKREVGLALFALGHQPDVPIPPHPAAPPLELETVRLSEREVGYPLIHAAHGASCLTSTAEVRAWRTDAMRVAHQHSGGPTYPMRPLAELPEETLEEVIPRRGSTRRFAHEAIAYETLSTMLIAGAGAIATDSSLLLPAVMGNRPPALNDLYLIVNAVDGLPSGTYVYDSRDEVLELLREGNFRQEAGFLDLGQELAADASVNFYLLADLGRALERFGNRGYRAAQIEASIIGGRLYLAAYALRLGATGLTFFDDDVSKFFSPHAAGKSVMFLVAAGRPRKTR